jgi:hypothetical protein
MRVRTLLLGGVAGAALMFILDPRSGRRRRATARDRLIGTKNRTTRRARRFGRRTGAELYGAKQKMTHRHPERKPPPNDATLAHTVESELFRDPDVPKGRININAEHGVIVLRGEIDRPEQITAIEEQVRKVPGVFDVDNLLHLRGTPAPNKAPSLEADAARLNQRLPQESTAP